ncbi:MAG: 3D-(3,5/4)-trihydroxycyclohexane-1,2-dione acylhydrolase (decyclizing) [Clostridia bacterium]
MNTIKLTVGQAIVKYLDNQYVTIEVDGEMVTTKYVENFYTIFGHGCVLGVGEALSQAKHNLKVLQGKNEQGMAQAAISYAKMNNRQKIIPCISSIGPGAANMVTAAATATVNNLPLLLFMGDSFASRQPDPVLQQVEQFDSALTTTNDAFKAVTRYFDRVSRPEMIMSALTNALRCLTNPVTSGAVAIGLCQDVQGESYDYPEEFFRKRVHFISRTIPNDYEVRLAVEKIKGSKKPLVIVGGGVRYSLAGKIVAEFCKKHNIPFAETQGGKSAIASSNPLNLGGIGVTGNSCANDIAKISDLIIGIGTRFSDFTTSSKLFFANADVVAINVSDFHASKLDSTKLIADAIEGVRALDKYLVDYKSGYTNEIENAKLKWNKEKERLQAICYNPKDFVPENKFRMEDSIKQYINDVGGFICQTTAIGLIRKIIPSDAVIVGASGSLPGCLQRMWSTDSIGSYNMEYGYSCMGYEIAGAFGAKLSCPKNEVFAMVGDGSYNMLHSEMLTAVQEGLKINILLFDNASFGCINNLQMGQGVDSLCTELRYRKDNKPIREGHFLNVDYAMCAKGYGFESYTARTMEELEKALELCLLSKKSTLIDIKVLPKTMTNGYDSWWNVGCVDIPTNDRAKVVLKEKTDNLKKARKY